MDLGTQKGKAVILKDGIIEAQWRAFSGFDLIEDSKTVINAALKQVNLQLKDIECSVATGLRFRPYGYKCVKIRVVCEGITRERAEITGGG